VSRGESIVPERFLRHPDRVVTKAQLGDSLHSLDQDYTDNSIQVHVHRVRRRMAELGADVTIRALRGLGYMAIRLDGGRAGASD
jgi:DNA-binding response OmpR family regulator